MVCGSLLFPGILSQVLADESPARSDDPLAPKRPHYPGKAKRVIFLYMSGGVSHVEAFDPKPKLFSDHGKTITVKGKPQHLKQPNWKSRRYGKSGTAVSDLFPHIGGCIDDICLIRSMVTGHNDHIQATLGLHTGSFTVPRPSIGSWVSYGLGTENRNLPSFMVLAPHLPYSGQNVWSANFLPGIHAGTRVVPGPVPLADLEPDDLTGGSQDLELGLMRFINRRHLAASAQAPALATRIQSFETAFRMQQTAPDVFDLSRESDATLALYGLQRGQNTGFGWQCLVARRLSERGVRFVELIDSGANRNWDSHDNMQDHEPLARNVDQAIAGLLRDLKARGMMDDTLVVWATEFGRTPFVEQLSFRGREHHERGFSCWLAGAGVKPGYVHGATDEHGIDAVDRRVHVHDFHATILHLLGFDHERLTYRHAGRDYRLTDVEGHIVRDLLA